MLGLKLNRVSKSGLVVARVYCCMTSGRTGNPRQMSLRCGPFSYRFERPLTDLHRAASRSVKQTMKRTKKEAFATGTSQNLVVQWKSFFLFCVYFQFQPVPATIECVCLFAQFFSRTFKAVTSIQNYISGVRTLHALLEAPFHSADNIELKLTLRGLKRSKPHAVRQAAPLSPHILCKVHSLLDLTTPFDATLWALLLVAFFTLSRKSNLVVTGKKAFDRRRQLCRFDVLIGEKGLLVQFRWSKTNQFGK